MLPDFQEFLKVQLPWNAIVFQESMLPDFQEFLKVKLPWNVIIAAENLKPGSLMLQRAILIRLLSDFTARYESHTLVGLEGDYLGPISTPSM